jgi:hypothetical protein
LEMIGMDTSQYLFHGLNMLDKRATQRVVFMMNTELSPVDGYHWNGYFFTFNNLSGIAYVATNPALTDALPLKAALEKYRDIPVALQNPGKVIHQMNDHANVVAAYILARGKHSQQPDN